MQNSKLSTIIFPKLNDSWKLFIEKVKEELEKRSTQNMEVTRKASELKNIIPLINKAKEESKNDLSQILKYKDLFVSKDPSLSSLFDALLFFKEQNNFDNDAVRDIYNRIIGSKVINGLNEEYSESLLEADLDKNELKPLENLIRNKKFDFTLIKELLNKFELDDKTKRDVLLYSLVVSSVKQSNLKLSTVKKSKQDKKLEYQEQFSKLKQWYENINNENNNVFDISRSIVNGMGQREIERYIKYIDDALKAPELGFSNEEVLFIYSMALPKVKEDIDDYIEAMGDITTKKGDQKDEILFFETFINEFNSLITGIKELYQMKKLKEQEEENEDSEDLRVFFALDPFNRVIPDKNLVKSNKSSINAFIRKVNSSRSAQIEGIRVVPMLSVDEANELLGKTIYLLSSSNYKLAYVLVSNSVLILGVADSSDTKFNNVLNHIVRGGYLALQRQIELINERNSEYIELQRDIKKELLDEKHKQI